MPYVGEIRMFAGSYAPAGWMTCEGQILPISENETLFNLIGTTYGGDGEETFALPNLASRLPLHQGTGGGGTYILGEAGGVEEVTLTVQQIPSHTHSFVASSGAATSNSPIGNVVRSSPSVDLHYATTPDANMAAAAIMPAGGSQAHSNLQPYLGINFIISLFGVFPQA